MSAIALLSVCRAISFLHGLLYHTQIRQYGMDLEVCAVAFKYMPQLHNIHWGVALLAGLVDLHGWFAKADRWAEMRWFGLGLAGDLLWPTSWQTEHGSSGLRGHKLQIALHQTDGAWDIGTFYKAFASCFYREKTWREAGRLNQCQNCQHQRLHWRYLGRAKWGGNLHMNLIREKM